MANSKITWQELRKAIVEHAHCTEQEAEKFLDALLESVIEGLKADKLVKIKGLGVFSLKAVAPRKSVNIATGEDFTIEGYNKLTFSAESTLKESVEKRIEKPATEDVLSTLQNDPMKKLGEQADEIVDILAELGQAPVGELKETKEEATPQEEKSAEKKPKAKKVKDSTKKAEEPKAEEPAQIAPITENKKCKCACSCKWMWWVFIAMILASTIGTGVYYREEIVGWWHGTVIMNKPIKKRKYHDMIFEKNRGTGATRNLGKRENQKRLENFCNTMSTWWECIKFWQDASEEIQEVTYQGIMPLIPQAKDNTPEYDNNLEIFTDPFEIQDTVATIEEISTDLEETTIENKVSLIDQARVYNSFIGTETVSKDSRLTWIAYKYYGKKDLWVFIYEANRNVIDHPARINQGLKLRIPKLDTKYMDLNNPELRQLVDELTAEYLK